MALINLPVIVMLGKTVMAALRDYAEQRKSGKDPVFLTKTVGLREQTDFWNGYGKKMERTLCLLHLFSAV